MLENQSIHAFIQKNRLKTESGQPFDLATHFFWYDVFSDWSPKQVWLKAAQLGGSSTAIIKSLWAAENIGLNIGYTLPTADDVRDFVRGKVNPIIAENDVLKRMVADQDSIEQKRVGKNTIYYRGTWVERAALSVSLDLRIHDEVDRSKQDIVAQYESRLQHSKYGWEWHFSNPSVPGNGVSRQWEESDKKHWFITCSKCKFEQYMKWPENIDPIRKVYICRQCNEILSDNNRRVGRWVQKYKNREWSGYWFSALMAPWIPATYVLEQFRTKPKDYFWNFVLGLPYVGEGNSVTPQDIFQNLVESSNSQENVVIGVDSGIVKHIVVGNAEGFFYNAKTEDWDDVAKLLKRFPRSIAVIDAMPDITGPRDLREKFPGRVFLCHYVRDRKTMEIIRWGKGKDVGNVLIDRNRMMQMLIDELVEMRLPLHGTRDEWSEMAEHFGTLYRMTETNSLGVPEIKWLTRDGNDHLVHAAVLCRAGIDKRGLTPGAVIAGDADIGVPRSYIITPDGKMTPPGLR